jgi:hypothetical protein
MHLVARLAAILSLRAGPQTLPAAPGLLTAIVVVDLLLSVAVLSTGLDSGQALLMVAMSIGAGLLFCYAALYLRSLSNRFLQTATALFGTDIIITLVAMPLSFIAIQPLAPDGTGTLGPDVALGLLIVTVWVLAVVGGIFRHALELSWPAALAVALAYVVVTASITL